MYIKYISYYLCKWIIIRATEQSEICECHHECRCSNYSFPIYMLSHRFRNIHLRK